MRYREGTGKRIVYSVCFLSSRKLGYVLDAGHFRPSSCSRSQVSRLVGFFPFFTAVLSEFWVKLVIAGGLWKCTVASPVFLRYV